MELRDFLPHVFIVEGIMKRIHDMLAYSTATIFFICAYFYERAGLHPHEANAHAVYIYNPGPRYVNIELAFVFYIAYAMAAALFIVALARYLKK